MGAGIVLLHLAGAEMARQHPGRVRTSVWPAPLILPRLTSGRSLRLGWVVYRQFLSRVRTRPL